MAEILHSLVGWTRFAHHLCAAFCSRLEETSDVIYGRFVGIVVPYNCVKFDGPLLNRSGFFFAATNLRPEVVSDVMSGANEGQVGMDVHENEVILAQTVLAIYNSKAWGQKNNV